MKVLGCLLMCFDRFQSVFLLAVFCVEYFWSFCYTFPRIVGQSILRNTSKYSSTSTSKYYFSPYLALFVDLPLVVLKHPNIMHLISQQC